MSQAVNCDLLLYADDSCLVYMGNDTRKIENELNKNFNCLCDWFVENKLSIHFGEDKTKSILFGTKRKLKGDHKIEINRGDVKIKQHTEVKYLGCIFDSNLSVQCAQNKCLRFCLNLDNRAHLDKIQFKEINWLPVNERVNQRMCVLAFNYFNNTSPLYMSEIFIPMNERKHTRNSQNRFIIPFRKTNTGQNALSYTGTKLWNALPIDVKLAKNRNALKHKMKTKYFD